MTEFPKIPGALTDLILTKMGKGPGFILLGMLEASIAGLAVWGGHDVAGLAAAFGAINVAVYGGGAWKAHATVKHQNGGKHVVATAGPVGPAADRTSVVPGHPDGTGG